MFWIFWAVACTVGWLLDNRHTSMAMALIVLFGLFYLVDKWLVLKYGEAACEDIDDEL